MNSEQRQRLQDWLSQTLDAATTLESVDLFQRGPGRESWLLILQQGDDRKRLILYRALSDAAAYPQPLKLTQEYAVHQAAEAAGIRVPHLFETGIVSDVLETPFYLMDAASNSEPAPSTELAQQLAQIHALDTSPLVFLPAPQADISPAQKIVNQLKSDIGRMGVQSPALEFGLRWAGQHLPNSEQRTLIHGGFCLDNAFSAASNLHLMMDWKYAHLGDPLEELGCVIRRDACVSSRDRQAFLTAYEEASGHQVNQKTLAWWEIIANLRATLAGLSLPVRDVAQASRSRHAIEAQFEALRLIEAQGI